VPKKFLGVQTLVWMAQTKVWTPELKFTKIFKIHDVNLQTGKIYGRMVE
jgi:hypothetical protein